MKAAVVERLGSAPGWMSFDDPVAQGDEQLVGVTAAAVKQLDRAIVAGTHYSSPKQLPFVPGTDGVGTLADGTRVYFAINRRPFGGLAERAPASWTVPLPDGLDDALAAALVNPALGSFLPVGWRGGLRPGESVMVLGATGTTGSLAVKAARLMGAGRVIAAGRRRDVLDGLDADAVIDLAAPAGALRAAFDREIARGLDLIIDYVWGQPVELLLDALTAADLHVAGGDGGAGTRLVSVGSMAAPAITLKSAALRGSRLSILGSGTGNFPPVDKLREVVAEVLDHAAAGRLALPLDVRPIADIATAWDAPAGEGRLVFALG